ncbi:hypothetical protein [Enterobacter sp. C4G1]|uniref:hypothetical protein n=1 Tax=Enterobacter sp. C4G1 TaxID=3458724 RepID=UPI0040675ED2
MIIARFALNGLPTSILSVPGVGNFPAFSGQQYGRNNSTMQSRKEIGPRGLSEGCITLSQQADFDYLRNALLNTTMMPVPCTSMRAYGTITVT